MYTEPKTGTVLKYYENGMMYLVDFGNFKECFSRVDLFVGAIRADFVGGAMA